MINLYTLLYFELHIHRTQNITPLFLLLLFLQMLGTISPIFLFPQEVCTIYPYAPTLERQYIYKNMVLISAGFLVVATMLGGKFVDEPAVDDRHVG